MKNKLTHAEMLVMGIIWDAKRQLVLSEVVAKCNGFLGKDWKPQTVSTYLAHLVRKGYLKMRRNGRAYSYEPLKAKEEYMVEMLKALCDWYSPAMKVTDIVDKLYKGEQE